MTVGNIVVILVNVRIITTGGNTNMIMILVDVDIIEIVGNIENVNVLLFVVIVTANIGKIIHHFWWKILKRLVLYKKGQVFLFTIK